MEGAPLASSTAVIVSFCERGWACGWRRSATERMKQWGRRTSRSEGAVARSATLEARD